MQYEDYMQEIKKAVMQGTNVKFTFPMDFNLSTEQYRLRRALKATELHRNVLGGEYAGLGAMVTVRTLPEEHALQVVPKAPPQAMVGMRVDEEDALQKLKNTKSQDNDLLEFYPSDSFNEQDFRESCEFLGWDAHKFIEEDDGKLMVAVTSQARGRTRAAMKRLGFSSEKE